VDHWNKWLLRVWVVLGRWIRFYAIHHMAFCVHRPCFSLLYITFACLSLFHLSNHKHLIHCIRLTSIDSQSQSWLLYHISQNGHWTSQAYLKTQPFNPIVSLIIKVGQSIVIVHINNKWILKSVDFFFLF